MYSKLLSFLLILLAIGVFFYDSSLNYAKHTEMRRAFVDHPEFIPSSQSVRLTSG